MELPADVEYVEDANLFIWRPRGILDEASVNKVLVELLRRETMAAKPFNRFSDLSLVEFFTSLSNMFFMSLFTGAFPMSGANR